MGVTKRRELRLRLEHLGLHLPGQVLRLDLYRLVCYFHTSEHFAKLSDSGDGCPWQGLRDEFQNSEIMRILLQTAVAVRFAGSGHADPLRRQRERLEDPVGKSYRNARIDESEPLPLREACNKVIHAKNIVLDSNGSRIPHERYIKPRIFCYDDFQQQTGWKAEIDVLPFVERCDAFIAL